MFFCCLLIWNVILVKWLIVLVVNVIDMFLVSSSVLYCLVSVVFGLVRMCMKLFLLSVFSFIWIGKWFCSLGIRLLGLVRWNVLEVMNRMWLVLIVLYLVDMLEFFISGSRLCCMFLCDMLLLDVLVLLCLVILLILLMNMMLCCLYVLIVVLWMLFLLISLLVFFLISSGCVVLMFSVCFCVLVLFMLENIWCSCWFIFFMFGGVMMFMLILVEIFSLILCLFSLLLCSMWWNLICVLLFCVDGLLCVVLVLKLILVLWCGSSVLRMWFLVCFLVWLCMCILVCL